MIIIFFWVIYIILKFLLIVLPLLISVAYLTLWERKIMAAMQRRRGPNVIGFCGLLQPLADGLKLFSKETILPERADMVVFFIAPILTFGLSISSWLVLNFSLTHVVNDFNYSILFLFAISSLGVYGIITSGWSSNSKYAFLGALRSAAQMVSYEVSIGLILLIIFITTGSLNLRFVIFSQHTVLFIFGLLPAFILFFISSIAETNRPPFDLPEAEAELVSGYNVEYSAMGFALFFLGEYANIILMACLTVSLFLGGGWSIISLHYSILWFVLKVLFVIFVYVWIRASFPRYRYDQLMMLGWKVFLPISMAFVVFVAGLSVCLF